VRCESCEREVERYEGSQAARKVPVLGPGRLRAPLRPAGRPSPTVARERGLSLRVAPPARAGAALPKRASTQPLACRSARHAHAAHRTRLRRSSTLATVHARGAGGWDRSARPLVRRDGPANRRPVRPPRLPVGPSRRHAAEHGRRGAARPPVRDAIYRRRFALKNRERLNRLLMQLHLNGLGSQTA
jgi:hypothetical protein